MSPAAVSVRVRKIQPERIGSMEQVPKAAEVRSERRDSI